MSNSRKTVSHKLIESHLLEGEMKPGTEIALKIDQTLTQDATGTLVMLELEAMGLERVKAEICAQYVDHNLIQEDYKNADDHLFLQSACQRFGAWFSRAGNGVSHPVHMENFGVPGKTLLGADSHTPANGSLGMLAIGAGGLEVALAMAGLPFYVKMPKIWGVYLDGKFPKWVSAKDVILEMLRRHDVNGGVGKIIEYYGPGLKHLSAMDRHVIANMGAELGATTTVFPSDLITKKFLQLGGRGKDWQELLADKNCKYDIEDKINLSKLEPLIATPSSPGNVVPVKKVAGEPVYQCYVGSSANPGYRDIAIVAEIMKGWGVKKNAAAGFEVAKYAAENDNAFAQNIVGYCYYYGVGTYIDRELAKSWYEKAVKQDTLLSIPAWVNLGLWYQIGYGHNYLPNLIESRKCYQRVIASEISNSATFYNLYKAGGLENDSNWYGYDRIKRDAKFCLAGAVQAGNIQALYEQALQTWSKDGLESAAFRGHKLAQFYLGRRLLTGWTERREGYNGAVDRIEHKANPGEAIKWLQQAAHTICDAKFILAQLYSSLSNSPYGQIVSKNNSLAVEYLLEAATEGHLGAIDLLSTHYIEGAGVPQDYGLAAEWKQKAYAIKTSGSYYSDNTYSKEFTKNPYFAELFPGFESKDDPEAIFALFKQQAENDDLYAWYNLGVCYYFRMGVPKKDLYDKDIFYVKEAEDCFKKAEKSKLPVVYLKLAEFTHRTSDQIYYYLRAKKAGDNEIAPSKLRDFVSKVDPAIFHEQQQRIAKEDENKNIIRSAINISGYANNSFTDIMKRFDFLTWFPKSKQPRTPPPKTANRKFSFSELTKPVLEKVVQPLEKLAVSINSEIKFSELQLEKQVGKGSFGEVWKAQWNYQVVAVKKMLNQELTDEQRAEFEKEVEVMRKLKSPYIVRFLGYGVKTNCFIVMEYVAGGSLYNFIHVAKQAYSSQITIQIGINIAKGLQYLHDQKPAIIHRDLKSLNILLADDQGNIKVADFGLVKVKNSQSIHTKLTGEMVGTVAWAAPEILSDAPYSIKSDMYSYGVVLWEMSTGQLPWKECTAVQIITKIVNGKRLEVPQDALPSVKQVMQFCFRAEGERLTAKEAIQILEAKPSRSNVT